MRKASGLKTFCLALLASGLAFAEPTFAQTGVPGVVPTSPPRVAPPAPSRNPMANQPAIPGAVNPANPNAATRPQVPNISGSPVVKPRTTTGCGAAGGAPAGRTVC